MYTKSNQEQANRNRVNTKKAWTTSCSLCNGIAIILSRRKDNPQSKGEETCRQRRHNPELNVDKIVNLGSFLDRKNWIHLSIALSRLGCRRELLWHGFFGDDIFDGSFGLSLIICGTVVSVGTMRTFVFVGTERTPTSAPTPCPVVENFLLGPGLPWEHS